jgi:hypothetical protein
MNAGAACRNRHKEGGALNQAGERWVNSPSSRNRRALAAGSETSWCTSEIDAPRRTTNRFDPTLADAAERLQERYAHGDGPLSDDEVLETVEDVADELRVAPVQTFVPLIAEHLARDRLQHRVDEQGTRQHDETD